MYIETVPNRNSKPAILLREGKRDGKRVVKTTLANLSHWPEEKVEALRRVLRGELPGAGKLSIERSLPHGHVQAVLGFMRKLGVDKLLASRPCRERDLVLAMIAQRLLDPCSKLATTRAWHATTLEWQTPDHPPKHGNWGHHLPEVHRWAYDYSVPGYEDDYIPQNVPPDKAPAGRDHGGAH